MRHRQAQALPPTSLPLPSPPFRPDASITHRKSPSHPITDIAARDPADAFDARNCFDGLHRRHLTLSIDLAGEQHGAAQGRVPYNGNIDLCHLAIIKCCSDAMFELVRIPQSETQRAKNRRGEKHRQACACNQFRKTQPIHVCPTFLNSPKRNYNWR